MQDVKQAKKIADFFSRERQRLIRSVRGWIADAAEIDGEDIVQDVALNIFDRADVSLPIDNLSAYVYRALRNRVIDLRRKKRQGIISLDSKMGQQSDLSLSDLIRDYRYNAADEFEKKEIWRLVFEAIEQLSNAQKAVIIETELEGKTFKELSAKWGVPLGTLLARKSRALQKIKKMMRTDHVQR